MLGRPYQFNSTKIRQGMTLHASFFINNVFFQLTSVLLNFSINLASNIAKKVCLIHVDILLWHFLDLVCLCLCLRQGLFVSYRCDLFFINIPLKFFKGCLPQILLGSLMNTLSHIFSLKQTIAFLHILFSSSQKFDLRELLCFCLIFWQFHPGVVYKSVRYKKCCLYRTKYSRYVIYVMYSFFKVNSKIVCKKLINIDWLMLQSLQETKYDSLLLLPLLLLQPTQMKFKQQQQ